MDIVRVRELTDLELGAELATQRRHLYDLRFQLATRQLTDHSQLTQARRTIARLLTVVTERGLNENDIVRRAAPAAESRRTLRRGRGTKASAPAAKTATKTTGTSRSATPRRATTKSKEAATEAASGGNEE